MPTRQLALGILLAVPTMVSGQTGSSYDRQVKPVLRERCYACHGALKQEAGLRLDTAAAALRGGDSGPAVRGGSAADSLLIARVTASDPAERMPPEGAPLTAKQIEDLRSWIAAGATAPADDAPEPDPRDHWAFRPPVSAAVVGVAGHPIDALLEAEQRRLGLTPLPPAEPRQQLRRLYLDLVGYPPLSVEVEAFLADDRPDAWERVVDRLLASPAYGERWGRHWLDIWRYSDWYGLGAQLRNSQKHMWHWRDWVVESLNADRGYDELLRSMLAADELTPDDLDELRATGFLARNYYLFNRTTWLDDTLEHTSKAFLALTMNCTKCHDHKYDPLAQLDYYRLRAVFEPHQVRLDALPGTTDLERDGLPRVFDAHPDAPTWVHVRGDDRNPDKTRPIEPGVPALLANDTFQVSQRALPPVAYRPALRPYVLRDQLQEAASAVAKAEAELAKATSQLAAIERRQPPADLWGDDAALLVDSRFSSPLSEQFEVGPGDWRETPEGAEQTRTGAERMTLTSKVSPPADFAARCEFVTRGGDQWKSVGLAFDVVGEREKLVYLSAVAPGSKVQIAYNQGAGTVYPNEAKQDREVALNEPHTLEILVRGQLVHVTVDGQPALTYTLPVPREEGRLVLLAFDAHALFRRLRVRALPPEVPLPAPGEPTAPSTVEQARGAQVVAQAELDVARGKSAMLEAAHRADRARLGLDPHGDADNGPTPEEAAALVRSAAEAARRWELAQAAVGLAKAELEFATAAPDKREAADKKRNEAQTKRAAAEQALANPGDTYPSAEASLKALEGPEEPDASRRQPYPAETTGRRAAFAAWLTDTRNPLTARVAANHIWGRHFGTPLVDPVNDFGRRTPAPPLLKLLDYLAVELMRGDGVDGAWRMKRLHRLIVTSAAYRRDSSVVDASPDNLERDPTNAYCWRRKPLRMESEVLRDSLLGLSGALHEQLGGPSLAAVAKPEQARRSLYFLQSRDDQQPFLSMFDQADILGCYRRTESIVPQQALALANSELALATARRISGKLEADDASPEGFARRAFESILGVAPTAEELTACVEVLAGADGAEVARRREVLIRALLNHNDFVTIR